MTFVAYWAIEVSFFSRVCFRDGVGLTFLFRDCRRLVVDSIVLLAFCRRSLLFILSLFSMDIYFIIFYCIIEIILFS